MFVSFSSHSSFFLYTLDHYGGPYGFMSAIHGSACVFFNLWICLFGTSCSIYSSVLIFYALGQVDIFMDVAFDSLHEDMRILSARLLTYDTKAFSAGPFDSQLTHFICQQCEASLQFLLLLCQQKLFRDRILKNKVSYI
jgi:hypothetical protein